MSAQKKRFTSKLYRDKTGQKASQRLLDLRKAQLDIHSKVRNALKTSAKTIPELARETGLDSKTTLWYLSTYYKYNQISVVGKTDDGYYRYGLKTEK